MVINGQEYATVAIVDSDDYLLAVLSDNECVCADNLRVIAESDDGGLVFQDAGDKRVKCFIRKDNKPLEENQITTSSYLNKAKQDMNVKLENRITKFSGNDINSGILGLVSKLPPQVIEAAIKNIIGNTAVFKQNQKIAEKQASEQEKAPEENKETSEKKDE